MYTPPTSRTPALPTAAPLTSSISPLQRLTTKRSGTHGSRVSSLIQTLEAKRSVPEQPRPSFRHSQVGSWRQSSRNQGFEEEKGRTTPQQPRPFAYDAGGTMDEKYEHGHKSWERRSSHERQRGQFYNRAALAVSISPAGRSDASERPNPFGRRDSSGSEVRHVLLPSSRRDSLSRLAFERVRVASPSQPVYSSSREPLRDSGDTVERYITCRLSERWSASPPPSTDYAPRSPSPVACTSNKHVDAPFVLDMLRTIDHILTDHTATLRAVIAQSEDLLRQKEYDCLAKSCEPAVYAPQPLPATTAAVLSRSPDLGHSFSAHSGRSEEDSDIVDACSTPAPSIRTSQRPLKRQRSVSGSPIRIPPLRIRVPVTQQPLQTPPQPSHVSGVPEPQSPSPQPFIRLVRRSTPSPADVSDAGGPDGAQSTVQRTASDQIWQNPSPGLLEYDRDAALAARASFQPLASDPSSSGVERRSSTFAIPTRSIHSPPHLKPSTPLRPVQKTEQNEDEKEEVPEFEVARQDTSRNSKAVRGTIGGWRTQRPVLTGEVRPLYEPVGQVWVGNARKFWGKMGKGKGRG